jgi:hypothetical protein
MRRVRVLSPCHESWEAMAEGEGGRRCERCNETVHDFVGREAEAVPGVCGRIGRAAGAAIAVAVAGGLIAAAATAAGEAVASSVPRDAGPAIDGGVDAEPPLMGKLGY